MADQQSFELLQFLDQEQLQAQRFMSTLGEEYVQKVADILSDQPINYPRKKSERISRRLIEDGERLQFNSSDDTLSSEINNWPADYECLRQMSYLLLPSAQQVPGRDVKRTSQMFYSNMKKVFDTDVAKEGCVVRYESLFEQAQQFFNDSSSKSAVAFVVCTGKATSKTVQIGDDKVTIELGAFMEKIRLLLDEAHSCNTKPNYPKSVVVIFTPHFEGSLEKEHIQVTLKGKEPMVAVYSMELPMEDCDVPRIDSITISDPSEDMEFQPIE